jgi:hypothetical protein
MERPRDASWPGLSSIARYRRSEQHNALGLGTVVAAFYQRPELLTVAQLAMHGALRLSAVTLGASNGVCHAEIGGVIWLQMVCS